MIPLPRYKNLHVAVYGLGRTGLSTIKAILLSGGVVYAWDDNLNSIKRAEDVYKDCMFVHPNEIDWSSIAELILSPGVPTNFPEPHWIVELARKQNCIIKSDVQVFLESLNSDLDENSTPPKIVCVTGTNGKSTTTSLIGHVLNTCGIDTEVGGNIGYPVLEMNSSRKAYVLELSSFQIDITDSFLGVEASVFLNLTPDHLDRHGTMENYARVKEKLVVQSKLAVLGCDSATMQQIYTRITCPNKIAISAKTQLTDGVSVISNTLFENGKTVGLLNMKVNHVTNAENIAAAFAVCRNVFEMDGNRILAAMESFQGLPHRCEMVGIIRNVSFVNDSKSTNAASSEHTLVAYENIYWILGGRSKAEGIDPLCQNAEKLKNVTSAFLIGESTDRFASSLHGILKAERCGDLSNALEVATARAFKNQAPITILLSPACASFDQWKSFEERGNAFRSLVEKLKIQEAQLQSVAVLGLGQLGHGLVAIFAGLF